MCVCLYTHTHICTYRWTQTKREFSCPASEWGKNSIKSHVFLYFFIVCLWYRVFTKLVFIVHFLLPLLLPRCGFCFYETLSYVLFTFLNSLTKHAELWTYPTKYNNDAWVIKGYDANNKHCNKSWGEGHGYIFTVIIGTKFTQGL